MPCLFRFRSILRYRTFDKSLKNSNFCKRNFYILNKHHNTDDDSKKDKESPLKRLLEDAASFDDAKPKSPEQRWATMPYPEGNDNIIFLYLIVIHNFVPQSFRHQNQKARRILHAR